MASTIATVGVIIVDLVVVAGAVGFAARINNQLVLSINHQVM